MTEFRSRVFIALLIAGILGVALVNMVVDHRALGEGGRELPWWSGAVLDVQIQSSHRTAREIRLMRTALRQLIAKSRLRPKIESARNLSH